MIRLKDVSKFYYNKGIITSGFNKLSLEFNLGEFVVITGESGSGKSTLLNVISGLDSYEEGEMYINGKETSHYSDEDFENYRKKYISNIFQNFNLVNSYTVYQNIELVLLINGSKKRDVKKKIIELIKEVDLYKYRNTKVSKLSGGQKQRVAIARALAKNTPIIIADEPTGNLDTRAAESVMKTLSEVAKDKLVIVVTHNYEQMEDYATRKITMHDGKVIEDKVIKKTEEIKPNIESGFKQITFGNKLRLGIRNAFNIKTKFILLLLVYLFMGAALISETASFQKDRYLNNTSGNNVTIVNKSDKRIIIKKNDNTAFTEEDYSKISKLDNIDYIVKNDLELDSTFDLTNDDIYLSEGTAYNIKFLQKKLFIGKMPENSNEIVLVGQKSDYNLENPKKILNKTYYYMNTNLGLIDKNVTFKVVGIAYDETVNYGTCRFYGNEEFLNQVSKLMLTGKTTFKVILNNHSVTNQIKALDLIPVGTVYISEELNSNCLYSNCINKTINITSTSLYFTKSIDLKVNKTYNKNNFTARTGLTDYDGYGQPNILLNPADYNNLLDTNNYQSSVFIKDTNQIKDTAKLLQNINFKTYIVTDLLAKDNTGFTYILNIINLVVTCVLIIVMFFISYFIVKIILKSRNTYYSTLRILGSTKKQANQLIKIELLTITNIASLVIATLIILIRKNIIKSANISNLLSYMNAKEYILIYLAIVVMTYLISIKFAKSLFKNSAMKTYNEEA